MYSKCEEDSDYLQSLFLKPFCQRYCEQVTPPKKQQLQSSQNEHQKTKNTTCHLYNPVLDHEDFSIRRKSSYDAKVRQVDKSRQQKTSATPYLSRKIQQKGIAKQIRKKVVEKVMSVPFSLESTQQNWLIIKEMQTKLIQTKTKPSATGKDLSQLRRQSIRNELEAIHKKEDSKNIKTMMSYYKNKRLIKHMPKVSASTNLTNSEIQGSINLRIQNSSRTKDQLISSASKRVKKNIGARERVVKTQSNPFSDMLRQRIIKGMEMASPSLSSSKLQDFLRSSKVGFSRKRSRPKTQIRSRCAQHSSNSKDEKMVNVNKSNELCGWQLSPKHQGESMLLI